MWKKGKRSIINFKHCQTAIMQWWKVKFYCMSTTADIYTHLAFWDVFTDDLVDGQGLVFYAFRVWEWESIRLLGSSRRLLPTLNFGWRTTGRTGTITGAGHLNLAINCRLHKLEIGYAWGVGLSLANMRAKRPINPWRVGQSNWIKQATSTCV